MTSPYAKAIYAAASSLIASLLLVIDGGITFEEWLGVAAAVLAVTVGVFGLRNDPIPHDPV